MSNTLLPEENNFLGYLPLQSYLSQKKQVKNGVKCPQDKEELIRALILKDSLEKLGCTYEMFNKNSEKISKKKEKQAKQANEIFEQLDQLVEDQDGTQGSTQLNSKPLIVLDAQNVAMMHGRNKIFSVKGIHLAINYWQKNGHKVICFLPEYLFDYEQVAT